jgi:extracellular elastinolytic metalloproteinase
VLDSEVRVRFNPLSGGARLLASRSGVLSNPSDAGPEQIFRAFLAEHHEVLGLGRDDLDSLVLGRSYSGLNESITHLRFDQVVDDIPVFGADVRIHLNEVGQIVWLSSSAVPLAIPIANPQLSAVAAAQLAAANVRPALGYQAQIRASAIGPTRSTVFERGPFRRELESSLVLFPVAGGATLAWQVEVEPEGFPQSYVVLVDADSGAILWRHNRVNYAQGAGNVLQSDATMAIDPRKPDEHPAGDGASSASDPPNGCPPLNNLDNRPLDSQFRDSATVLFNSGLLEGNNGSAYRSTTGNPGAAGTLMSGVWHFDFAFNTADFAETQLFLLANFLHDFFYDLGFDEPSANFQEDNFGRGGIGSDGLNANARSTRAPGRNNAIFTTPVDDGENPSMEMFLWDGSGCWSEDVDGDGSQDLDGTIDSDTVIHEFHHGVGHRLIGGLGLVGKESNAIGEGGGDFFAYSVNGDTVLSEYSVPPDGIRQINAKTYGEFVCAGDETCSPPHFNGEIWANTLWDLRERYRTDLVGGSEAQGIHRLHTTYIGGLKLAPAAPTMLDLRDAMLQDDLLRNPDVSAPGGSQNYCRLWEGFAARGMGLGALDTNDTGINAVIERFNLPPPCGSSTPLPDGNPTDLTATAVASHQIILDWIDNASNELGYTIERCIGSDCTDFAWLNSVGANATAYSDGGLQDFTLHRYRVFAFNNGGDSSSSNVGQAVTHGAAGACGLPQALVLVSMVVLDEQLHEACLSIEAGSDVSVGSTGALSLTAGQTIELSNGFKVLSGGFFEAEINPALSER